MCLRYFNFKGEQKEVHRVIDVKVDNKGLHYRTDDSRKWNHELKCWLFEVTDYEI